MRYIVISFLFLNSLFLSGQDFFNPTEKPKLVIGITIDNLNTEYLYRYWDHFEEGGFKKLIHDGAFCRNTSIPYFFTNNASGYATIATGTTPSVHGITSEKWYINLKDKIITSTGENLVNVTTDYVKPQSISPEKILASTYADKINQSFLFQSKVISISPDSKGALLSSGHSA